MSGERDMTRIVRSWLRTDEHESADRVLDTVLALLDATPQRRSRWPARRLAEMNTYLKLGMAAAAVVVVAVVGINLLPRSGGTGGGGPVASPSPSPVPTPPATATPLPTPPRFPPAGELAPGRHSMTLSGIRLSLELATSGWRSNGDFAIEKDVPGAQGGFILWTDAPDGVYTDPCGQVKGPVIGPSVTDLAAAVASIPGTDLVSGPSDLTIGGHPAQLVGLTVREDVPCGAGERGFHLWYDEAIGGRWPTTLGSTIRVWIIDVDGVIVWIDGETYRGVAPAMGEELDQIVESIAFE